MMQIITVLAAEGRMELAGRTRSNEGLQEIRPPPQSHDVRPLIYVQWGPDRLHFAAIIFQTGKSGFATIGFARFVSGSLISWHNHVREYINASSHQGCTCCPRPLMAAFVGADLERGIISDVCVDLEQILYLASLGVGLYHATPACRNKDRVVVARFACGSKRLEPSFVNNARRLGTPQIVLEEYLGMRKRNIIEARPHLGPIHPKAPQAQCYLLERLS
jgi:hypothetical protein